MNAATAQKAMYFMNQAQLKGSEVGAFIEVMEALQEIIVGDQK
jgi:hypothetical protein